MQIIREQLFSGCLIFFFLLLFLRLYLYPEFVINYINELKMRLIHLKVYVKIIGIYKYKLSFITIVVVFCLIKP